MDIFGSRKMCSTYKGDDKFFGLIRNAYAYYLNVTYITYLKIKINKAFVIKIVYKSKFLSRNFQKR